MQRLWPEDGQDTPEAAFDELLEKRGPSWVYASSAITLNGKLGANISPYGGKGDWRWYHLMKDAADFIIVGGKTIRAGGQDPRWQPGAAAIVILSRSGNLPTEGPLFQKQGQVIVYTESEEDIHCPNEQLEVRRGQWDAAGIIQDLGEGRKMIDGGGEIYTMFAPFVHDWLLTTVPVFADASRSNFWTEKKELSLQLAWLWQEDNRLFTRYRQGED